MNLSNHRANWVSRKVLGPKIITRTAHQSNFGEHDKRKSRRLDVLDDPFSIPQRRHNTEKDWSSKTLWRLEFGRRMKKPKSRRNFGKPEGGKMSHVCEEQHCDEIVQIVAFNKLRALKIEKQITNNLIFTNNWIILSARPDCLPWISR